MAITILGGCAVVFLVLDAVAYAVATRRHGPQGAPEIPGSGFWFLLFPERW